MFLVFCSPATWRGGDLLRGWYGVCVFGALRASRLIHWQLIESVLGTTLRLIFNCLRQQAVCRHGPPSIRHQFLFQCDQYFACSYNTRRQLLIGFSSWIQWPDPLVGVHFQRLWARLWGQQSGHFTLCSFPSLMILFATGEKRLFVLVKCEMIVRATYSMERMRSYINAEQEPKPTKQSIPASKQ